MVMFSAVGDPLFESFAEVLRVTLSLLDPRERSVRSSLVVDTKATFELGNHNSSLDICTKKLLRLTGDRQTFKRPKSGKSGIQGPFGVLHKGSFPSIHVMSTCLMSNQPRSSLTSMTCGIK